MCLWEGGGVLLGHCGQQKVRVIMLGLVLNQSTTVKGRSWSTSCRRSLHFVVTGLADDGVLVLARRIGLTVHQQVVQDTAASVVSEQVAPGR